MRTEQLIEIYPDLTHVSGHSHTYCIVYSFFYDEFLYYVFSSLQCFFYISDHFLLFFFLISFHSPSASVLLLLLLPSSLSHSLQGLGITLSWCPSFFLVFWLLPIIYHPLSMVNFFSKILSSSHS